MLGHRGVRLGISFPEIYEMQIRAVLEATAECLKDGVDVHPEIMVPQVVTVEELKRVRTMMDSVRPEVEARYGVTLDVQVRHDGRGGARVHARRAARRGRRVLLVRHQRSDAGDLLVLARGRREQVPAAVHRDRHPARQPVRGARRRGRRAADAARRRLGPRCAARPRRSASAASTAGSRRRSASATMPGSTTSRARRPRVPIARLAAAQAALQAARIGGAPPRRRGRSLSAASPGRDNAAFRMNTAITKEIRQ